jgi:hypothetical protein
VDKLQLVTEAIKILKKLDENIDVKATILKICMNNPEPKIANDI